VIASNRRKRGKAPADAGLREIRSADETAGCQCWRGAPRGEARNPGRNRSGPARSQGRGAIPDPGLQTTIAPGRPAQKALYHSKNTFGSERSQPRSPVREPCGYPAFVSQRERPDSDGGKGACGGGLQRRSLTGSWELIECASGGRPHGALVCATAVASISDFRLGVRQGYHLHDRSWLGSSCPDLRTRPRCSRARKNSSGW